VNYSRRAGICDANFEVRDGHRLPLKKKQGQLGAGTACEIAQMTATARISRGRTKSEKIYNDTIRPVRRREPSNGR
jgi:hypothetical protein